MKFLGLVRASWDRLAKMGLRESSEGPRQASEGPRHASEGPRQGSLGVFGNPGESREVWGSLGIGDQRSGQRMEETLVYHSKKSRAF